MGETITWVMEHKLEVIAVITTALAFASSVAALTPTQKDDDVVARIKNVLGKFLGK